MPPRAEVPPRGDEGADDPAQELAGEHMPVEDRIAFLLAGMQDHPNDVNAVEMAMSLLVSLLAEHRDQVKATDAITRVFEVVQNLGDHERLMEICMYFFVAIQCGDVVERTTLSIHETERVASIVAVMSMFRQNEDIQRFGALILFPLGADDTTRNVLLEEDTLPALIFAIMENNIGLQRAGCLCICDLLENDIDGRAKQDIEKAGGVSILIKFLEYYGGEHHSGDENFGANSLQCVCGALSLLSERDSVKTAIVDLDGITTILTFIKCQTSNANLQYEALQILRSLGGSSGASEAFVDAGGVPILTSLMLENLDKNLIVGGVLLAFGSLTQNSQVVADALATEGGLVAIVKAMARYFDDVYLQTFACLAISACASVEDTSHVLHVLRSIPNMVGCIVSAMRKHTGDEAFQACGCNTLQHLAFSVKMCVDFVRSGGLLLLVSAMERFPDHVDLQASAIITIGNTAEAEIAAKSNKMALPVDLLESVNMSGAVPAIVHILSKHLDDDMLAHDAIHCLRVLAENNRNMKKQIESNGGVKILASIRMNSKRGDTAEQARLLLNCFEGTEDGDIFETSTSSDVSKKAATH